MAYNAAVSTIIEESGKAVLRYFFGDSDSDKERARALKNRVTTNLAREVTGKIPIIGSEILPDLYNLMFSGHGDVQLTNSPVAQQVGNLLRETSTAIYNVGSNQPDPDKSELQNFEAIQKKAERARQSMWGAVRSGATIAGVGAMPLVNLLRQMQPNAEVYGLAANWARRGDEDKAADVLARQIDAMRKADIPERELRDHLIEMMTNRLNRDLEKDDRDGRRDSERTARRVVSAALSR